jgi:membrane-associated PAP2 superfamily phosphatase
MNRTGLLLSLIVAAVTGLTFALYPELDLKIAGLFYDPARHDFPLRLDPLLGVLREESMWVVTLLVAPAAGALAVKVLLPFTRMLMSARAAVFLVTTLVLGPGLLVNVGMKDHWSRPRPINVAEFGGGERFVPWWDPRGMCRRNCSYVGGESAGAFWTLAPAALAPPHWRGVAYAAALTFGAAVGMLRMMFGGHFFSDVVFSGVFVFIVVWIIHGMLYRWRATRTSDKVIEHAIERATMPIWRAAGRLIRRVRMATVPGRRRDRSATP